MSIDFVLWIIFWSFFLTVVSGWILAQMKEVFDRKQTIEIVLYLVCVSLLVSIYWLALGWPYLIPSVWFTSGTIPLFRKKRRK